MKFIEQSQISNSTTMISQIQEVQIPLIKSSSSKLKQSNSKKTKICRWTPEQNVLYLRFLKQNLQKFTQKSAKKFLKFERMSFEIESKTPDQCRSHHQKMMMRFKSIENIIYRKVPQDKQESSTFIQQHDNKEIKLKMRDEKAQLLIQSTQCQEIKGQQEKQLTQMFNPFSDQNLFNVLFETSMF